MLVDKAQDALVGHLARAERLDGDAERLGDADGVGDLDLEAVGQTGSDHVLGHPARGIGAAAVDLGRVFAAECATAVAGHAAVGVDDDLAAGQAGVAHRPADDEAAGRVDVVGGFDRAQLSRNDRPCDGLDHVPADRRLGDFVVVLGGQDDRPHRHRLAELVLDGDLRLAVGPQVGQRLVLAHLRHLLREPMRQRDGQRHQLGCLAAGEAEHHSLVAGALIVADRRCRGFPRRHRRRA